MSSSDDGALSGLAYAGGGRGGGRNEDRGDVRHKRFRIGIGSVPYSLDSRRCVGVGIVVGIRGRTRW
jgi:hypothetical protein